MPGFDKTGPDGAGPMTGRRLGKCRDNDKNIDEQSNMPAGRGLGRGRGRGLTGKKRNFRNSNK